jgi:hypothetical protein
MAESKYQKYKASQNAWQRAHMRQIQIKFNVIDDRDIIEKLDTVENRTDYIRQLIRKDLQENK